MDTTPDIYERGASLQLGRTGGLLSLRAGLEDPTAAVLGSFGKKSEAPEMKVVRRRRVGKGRNGG